MAHVNAPALSTPTALQPSLLDGRVTFEPPPIWAEALEFDPDAPRHREEPLTCLLHSEQMHAEENACHTRIIIRLESMQGVQDFSQWRLDLDPLTQRLAVHSLQVRRGDSVTEHADPKKIRLLQLGESLEAFALHGHYTVVTLFEDVRPGDCLDVSYTITRQPLLFARNFHRMLFLPGDYAIDRYVLSVLHRPARGLRQLAAEVLGSPESGEVGYGASRLINWTWKGSLRERSAPEPNTPPWHLHGCWLQLSDLPHWGTVAAGVAAAWPAAPENDPLAEEARKIEADSENLNERVEIALRFVQDGFRYLSVNLELGGQIPAASSEVLRRRYGDCKDLALLLCRLLGHLGVAARPLLVHSSLGPRLPTMLPSPGMFNHVLVEFTLANRTLWVDATGRNQGGGPSGRSLAAFAFALPVDPAAEKLLAQPAPCAADATTQEINETILLDCRGRESILRVRQIITGLNADILRRQIESGGMELYQRERENFFARRYGKALIEVPFTHEDDRERNLIQTMEVYRVRGFVDMKRGGGRCAVNLPPSLALLALARPGTGERRDDWVVNHPVRLEHTMDVLSSAFEAMPSIGQTFTDNAVIIILRRKFLRTRWIQTVSLTTNLADLPAEKVKDHAQTLNEAWKTCDWMILSFAGLARPHRKQGFLEVLPLPKSLLPETRGTTPPETSATESPKNLNGKPSRKPKNPIAAKHKGFEMRSRKRRKPMNPWLWLVIGFSIAAIATAAFYYANR